jgi:hypothetical protein
MSLIQYLMARDPRLELNGANTIKLLAADQEMHNSRLANRPTRNAA